jgi:membrane protease YdiL (CAAX protease family)
MREALSSPPPPPKRATLAAMLFALLFPTVAAWSYFLALAGSGGQVNVWQQRAYVSGKIIQFTFPLVFVALVGRRHLPRRGATNNAACWRYALAFGVVVVALMLGLYFGVLRGSPLLKRTPERVREKLQQVNLDAPARYAALAAFVVVAHSLLEEYYWRWFVFGHLRWLMAWTPAAALSSLAFMAHHVIVLYVYLPGRFWTAALPLSLAIAAGGFVWAWLYERGGIGPPWLSHLLVDAGIFVVGWDLLWPISV